MELHARYMQFVSYCTYNSASLGAYLNDCKVVSEKHVEVKEDCKRVLRESDGFHWRVDPSFWTEITAYLKSLGLYD